MADFDQAQNELSSFLDTQFAEPREDETVPSKVETDDDEINQFLQGDDLEEQVEQIPQQVPAEQPPVQTAQVSTPEDRILQLERELAATKTRSQMYENALASQYQQQTAPKQEPEVPNVLFQDQELAVDERYEQDYGDANPYISAIAKRVANDLYQRTVIPLQQQLQAVQGQLQSQEQFNQSQRTDTLHMQLKSVVPDIDELVKTPEWQSYIKQPDVYGSGRTIASFVQEGIQYGNVRQLAQIVNQFKQARGQVAPKPQQVAPGRAQTTVPNTAPKRGKVLYMSEFDRATQQFQAGKLSWDKYQVIANEFNEAMLEGRVNHNK